MADEVIEYEVRVTGTEASTAKIESLNAEIETSGQTVTSAGRGFGELAGAVGNVGAVFGQTNPVVGRAGSLIGAVGTASTALTGALGPVGVAIAAVTAGLGLLMPLLQDTTDEIGDMADEADNAGDSFDRLVGRIRSAREQFNSFLRDAGEDALQLSADRIEAIDQRIEGLRSTIARARSTGDLELLASLQGQLSEAELQRGALQFSRGVIEGNTTRQLVEEGGDANERDRGRRGGRGGGTDPVEEMLIRREDAVRRGREREAAAALEREAAMRTEQELIQAQADKRAEIAEQEEERDRTLFEKRLEFIQQETEAREALFEKQKEAARESEEAFRRNAQEIEGFTQPIVSGLTRALSEVIAGAKTADQAFQGLLASFLEMIAQQTALQAAKEFAEAIAAFASQRYDEGALHLAAGAAYTAVAVAAGAGSIAVAPSAAAPASPEAGASDVGGGGGGTTVVNVNGPILSAGNSSGREELGAELGTIIREGNRRYGVAA